MKKIYSRFAILLLAHCLIISSTPLNAQMNVDFENGNFNGWVGTWGNGVCNGVDSGGQCVGCIAPVPTQYSGLHQGGDNLEPRDTFIHRIMTGGYDSYTGYVLPMFHSSGSYSACLGNSLSGGNAGSISYSYTVTKSNSLFTYHYAVVLTDAGHSSEESAYFKVRVYNDNGDSLVSLFLDMDGPVAHVDTNFHSASAYTFYRPWSSVHLCLDPYIGHTITITFTTRSCSPQGCSGQHCAYAYLDADVAACSIDILPTYTAAPTTFSLFPNPAANSVTISVDESMVGSTATITDITGRKIADVLLSTVNRELSTENFANGLYLITLTSLSGRQAGTGGSSATKKLIINK